MPAQPRGSGLDVKIRIDADRATDEFKEARRNLRRRTGDAVQRAGEQVALPAARVLAGNLKVQGIPTASTIVVKRAGVDAVLTTRLRGKLGRAVSLQEMGGTITATIRPANKKALVVNGQPVAAVYEPRKVTGRFFMTGAVQSRFRQIQLIVRDVIADEFADEFEVT